MRILCVALLLAAGCAPMFESSAQSTFIERARASSEAERRAFVQGANRCLANIDNGIDQLQIGLRPSNPPPESFVAWHAELADLENQQRTLREDTQRAASGELADFNYWRTELRTSIVSLNKRVRTLHEEMAARVKDPTYLASPRDQHTRLPCRGELCCPPLGT
ncbi:MAG TPA: hypothetical protein VFB62_05065 [Polyangiaceae bacterium]|jgi:hypothetical protein|nr:hypothetical protein [Polyangiaceae bacterium]